MSDNASVFWAKVFAATFKALGIQHCKISYLGVEAVLARVRRDPEFAAQLGAAMPAVSGVPRPAKVDLMDLSDGTDKEEVERPGKVIASPYS